MPNLSAKKRTQDNFHLVYQKKKKKERKQKKNIPYLPIKEKTKLFNLNCSPISLDALRNLLAKAEHHHHMVGSLSFLQFVVSYAYHKPNTSKYTQQPEKENSIDFSIGCWKTYDDEDVVGEDELIIRIIYTIKYGDSLLLWVGKSLLR